MKPEKKKAALAIILGSMKPKAEEPDDAPDTTGAETAMSEFGAALKAEDWKAAAHAFKSAMALCDDDDDGEPTSHADYSESDDDE